MHVGAPPQTPFSRGSGAPRNILAAKPPRGLGRSPNRRGPPALPLPLLATALTDPVFQANLPDKFKCRLQSSSSYSETKTQKSHPPSTSANTAPTPPAGASAQAASNAAAAALAAAGLDPFGGLFSPMAAMDPATLQLQMQLMMGSQLGTVELE